MLRAKHAALMLIANYRWLRRGDHEALLLARRWSQVAAVLFAVHPQNAEAVDWISGRYDLLAGWVAIAVLWAPPRPWMQGGLFLLGIIWLILFYVTNNALPVSALGNWNLLVGFAFIIGGFGVATQWR